MKTLIILTFAITIVFLNSGVSFSNKVTSETGYYEGSGYELWGFKDNIFVKICEGFYYGV